jgi:hypothetical protein
MSATLAPQLSCYITPPNGPTVDFGLYMVYAGGKNSISISQNFGRQGDTASLSVIDADYSTGVPPHLVVSPSFVIPAYSLVKIVDQNALAYYGSIDAATLFVGYVSHPTTHLISPTELEWNLSCVDYTGYANASVVQGLYEGIPMGDAVVDLVNKANCGIKAALITNGGYVQIGPTLPRTVIHYSNLTSALQKISKMASSQSAYGWYVDSELNLHFYDQQHASGSNVTVTDNPTSAGLFSFTECHIDQSAGLQYDYDGTSLYNRALVVGKAKTISTKVTNPPTDAFTGDGVSTSFTLSQVPDVTSNDTTATPTGSAPAAPSILSVEYIVTHVKTLSSSTGGSTRSSSKKTSPLPAITVKGVGQSVSVYDGITSQTTQWVIKQNDNGSWSAAVNPNYGVTPASGASIQVWYKYKTTITAQADLRKSQVAVGGPNHGIFATVVHQSSIDTTAAAYQRATRELAEYGHPQERISFTTSPEFVGVWRAGQTFTLKSQFILDSQRNFKPGLTAKFIITQQTCSVIQGGFRQWNVTAIRVT